MYQTMEIYMARKKQVPEHYNPDSYRIFDREVGDDSLGDSRMNKLHIERKNPPPPTHPREPERRNCPHPWHSRFLRHNARLLNEPICVMATESTDLEQDSWWPSRTSDEPLKVPARTMNTVQRSDYQHSAPVRGNTRHSSNPFTIPSKGILPVNTPKTKEDPGDVLLEKISYRHDYNSRLDKNEPIRGKLHGSFVWDEVLQTDSGKVVVTPWNKKLLHRCATVPITRNVETSSSKKNDQKGEKSPKKEDTPAKHDENLNNQTQELAQQSNTEIKSAKETAESQEGNSKEMSKKAETIPPIDGLPAPSAA
uniref:uncharacterized protein C2orf73 homolog n=1 Tax=Styela clava TaxID=7725 RepID=UPI00193A2FAC|nr:uncharacterized protein C2orf73 homolog [Styela clava]